MKLLINFILFQLGWFSVVLSAANGNPIFGVAIIALIIAQHIYASDNKSHELVLISLALIIGLIWDSAMSMSGLFVYTSGVFVTHLAPYWILAMWALFAITLNLSMRWIKGRIVLAAISGAVFGPLAYYAGYRLGAVEIPNMLQAMLFQALGWAIILPTLAIAARLMECETKLSLREDLS